MFGVDRFSSLNIPEILMALLEVLIYLVASIGKEGCVAPVAQGSCPV